MKRKVQTLFLSLLCFALLLNGGCTAALWHSVNPGKPVWVPCSQTTEEELQVKGVEYKKTRVMLAEPVDGYFVEKTGPQKLRDGVVLLAATPFTVVADGALFLGLAVLGAVTDDPSGLASSLNELCR
jgi:hypothetical protein